MPISPSGRRKDNAFYLFTSLLVGHNKVKFEYQGHLDKIKVTCNFGVSKLLHSFVLGRICSLWFALDSGTFLVSIKFLQKKVWITHAI